jgi:enoyl-CoA hydratase
MCGIEYFAHAWEFGPRKTKELMLTSDSIDAEECYRLGMVSKIFPPDELSERTVEFARRIRKIPTTAAQLVKESVNQTQDNQGFYNSLQACFTMHELNHVHWAAIHDDRMPAAKVGEDIPEWKGSKLKPARRDRRSQVVPHAGASKRGIGAVRRRRYPAIGREPGASDGEDLGPLG